MSAFPDTGPQKNGTRSAAQWKNAMAEDMGIIRRNVDDSLERVAANTPAMAIAIALKEARRLQSDLYRFAKEVHGIDREEIDKQGPL